MYLKIFGYVSKGKDTSEVVFMDNGIAVSSLGYVRDYSFKKDQQEHGYYYLDWTNEDWKEVLCEIAQKLREKDHILIGYKNRYEEFDTSDLEQAVVKKDIAKIMNIIEELTECDEEIDRIIIDFCDGKYERVELDSDLIISSSGFEYRWLEFILNLESLQKRLKEKTSGNFYKSVLIHQKDG